MHRHAHATKASLTPRYTRLRAVAGLTFGCPALPRLYHVTVFARRIHVSAILARRESKTAATVEAREGTRVDEAWE